MNKNIYSTISNNLTSLEIKTLFTNINQALNLGCTPLDIINNGLINGLYELNENIASGKAFKADMLCAARAIDLCSHMLIGGYYTSNNLKNTNPILIGTVFGDIHQIAKNLIKYILQSKGTNIIDLGCNVNSADFLNAAKKYNVKIVILSCSLSISAKEILDISNKIKDFDKNIKILAGGSALSKTAISESNADYYVKTIEDTVNTTLQILGLKGGNYYEQNTKKILS